MSISIREHAGQFAENKDVAQHIRQTLIIPELEAGREVMIDFDGVTGVTQSFIHALISDILRRYGSEMLDRLVFRHCNETVQKMIVIVTDYLQESWR